ncbi:hypothetical protein INT46_004241 [Mucor plumbeus]|uniref:Tc1-like transposase DDE domain-containing protein n=1 Tax=Mucor plumbeus TaxID=97098 RepID=A0A8H7V4B7_9FUNG|nr:hypothetical protein INT46_004241 [Mucor plumbeus]
MVRSIPTEVQNSIKLLLIKGFSYSAIQKMYPNVGLSTFSRYKRQFLSDSTSPKGGKQSKISTQTRNNIARNFQNSSFNGPKGVQIYLLTLGIEVSLRGTNFVNATNKRKLSAWAEKYQHYTVDDWRKWRFSDETRINMWGSDGKSYYWTDGATELLPYQIEPHIQGDGGSVLFLGLITAEKPGYGSTITEGNVNIEVYIDILQTSLKSFRFQQDNARPHTSVPIKQWFQSQGFSLKPILGWPPQNPDLNPIEHVWNQLKRRLNEYPARATTIAELEARIHQEWYKLIKEDCLKHIDSMPNRIKAVIRSKGGPTRY